MEKQSGDVCYFSGRLLWYFMISSGLLGAMYEGYSLLFLKMNSNYLGRKRSLLWLHVILSPLSMKGLKMKTFLLWFLIAIQLYPLNETWMKIKTISKKGIKKGLPNNPFYNSNLKNRNTIYMGKQTEGKRKKIYIFFTIFTKKNTSNFFDCAEMIYFLFHAWYIFFPLQRRVE